MKTSQEIADYIRYKRDRYLEASQSFDMKGELLYSHQASMIYGYLYTTMLTILNFIYSDEK